jgi:CRISPR-associated protein (TIGR03984 family)
VGDELKKIKLYTSKASGKSLSEAIEEFLKNFGNSPSKNFGIFYSPNKCFLARMNEKNDFEYIDKNGRSVTVNVTKVFEARIFNENAELRWLNETDGYGSAAVLCENEFIFFGEKSKAEICVEKKEQNYLLWGKKSGDSTNGWTKFAEARIGAFYVPVTLTDKEHAVFKAVEYFGEFEDGNVAVIDERLKGIIEYPKKGDTENGK